MAERFFLGKQNHAHGYRRRDNLTLLSGPASSGKTSLLFQFAFNLANDSSASKNSHVVFICHRRRMEVNPPFLSQGIDPSCDVFDRIQMKYVEDDEGIRKYFAAFHLHADYPAAVLVDDFSYFFGDENCNDRLTNSRARDMAMARSLALCHNAIRNAKEAPCELLLSETHHGSSPRSLYIYKRWISTIFTIKGDGHGSFFLRSNDPFEKTAKYSIAFQYLILEEITGESEA